MENGEEKKKMRAETPRVRTYERDVAAFMAREGSTAADIALAEQEKRIADKNISSSRPLPKGEYPKRSEGEGVSPTGKSPLRLADSAPPLWKRAGGEQTISVPSPQTESVRRNARGLLLWSILFVALAGVVGAGYWYLSTLVPAAPKAPASSSAASGILLADKEKSIDTTRLGRDTFIAAFGHERAASLPLSSFTRVVPTRGSALTASEFFSLLEAGASGEFLRALRPEFALGLRGLPTNRAFLVLKTNYFQTALAGMLAWEKTLVEDLGPLFNNAIGAALAPETSEMLTGRLSRFADATLRNRDVREFRDGAGNTLLLWGFADARTIVVTDDEDTFAQVAGRLVAPKR